MTGSAVNTVAKLLTEIGAACLDYQDSVMRDLPCRRLQCDEIWSFVYAKAKNVPGRTQRRIWVRRCVDLDGHRCGHKTCSVLARGKS